MNSGIPEQIKQALAAALAETDDYSMSRFASVANLKEARLDRILTALAPHFTQQPKGDDPISSEEVAVMSCAHWSLQYSRLQNAAQSLVATRRKLSDAQSAVLTHKLDALETISSERKPTLLFPAARLNTEIKTK